MELVHGLAHTEAVINFGNDKALLNDEDNGMGGAADSKDKRMSMCGTIQPCMSALHIHMDCCLSDTLQGELLWDRLQVAIVGRTNGGKLSLLNLPL